jgi:integrating conjugative element protein (TIGR03756 family)
MRSNPGVVLMVMVLALSGPVRADDVTIDSLGIVGASIDVGCMDFEVVGICIWMTCVLTACEFDFSVKTRHKIPEAVVAAYPIIGMSPWTDTASYAGPTSFAEEGGSSTEGGATHREQALRFKNADVIGSPGVYIYHALADDVDSLFCKPVTWGYLPYFLSTEDYNWRDPTVETGWSLYNALARVGKGPATFAGLFPRIGFVNQGHDYKASLVAAKRAVDIVRQPWQPHVYWPMTASATRQGYWPPTPDTEFLWQQLVPEVRDCAFLPDINDASSLGDPYAARLNPTMGNAWHVWRSYACCQPEGAVLIFHTGG